MKIQTYKLSSKLSFTKIVTIACMAIAPFLTLAKKQMPNFSGSFKKIEKNCLLYRAYNDSIHQQMDDSAWINLMTRRATCYQNIYAENNSIIDEITEYFQQDKKNIPNEAYDSLLVQIERGFNIYDLDNFLVEHLTQLVLPHYQEKQDTNNLVLIRHIAGVCNQEISRFQDPEAGVLAKKYLYDNILLSDSYRQLSPQAARIIPLDYMNYCYTLSALGVVTPSEAFNTTNRFEAFIDKNKDYLSEKMLSRCRMFLDRIRRTAARIHIEKDNLSKEDSIALNKMLESSPYNTITASDLKNKEDSISYYHYKYETKQMSASEADYILRQLTQELFDQTAQLDTITEFHIQSLCNALTASISIMDKDPLVHHNTRVLRVTSLSKQLVTLIHRAHIVRDPFFLESMLGQLACMKSIFKYLPQNEKAEFMSELAVKSQIGTIVHVATVNKLAMTLFDCMLKNCPEQFVGLLGFNSVEELRANQTAIKEWIGKAAEYHDLGKIGISPIFSNDFRRLTEREFTLSRKHPELAMKYLNVDSIFDSYKDVALGHHRWYNGKGGYPMSFDNTVSPYRSCIDFVTICDCIDAATDNLGRNYRKEKRIKEVLTEFKRDAGKLYNPVMVDAIVNDKKLSEQLDYIVTKYRFEQLKKVRNSYMK